MLLQREIFLGLVAFPSFNFSDIFWITHVTETVNIPAIRLLSQENTISDLALIDNEDRINVWDIVNNFRLNNNHLVHLNLREVKKKNNHVSLKLTFKSEKTHLEITLARNPEEI